MRSPWPSPSMKVGRSWAQIGEEAIRIIAARMP